MNRKIKKRFLSSLLAICIVLSIIPMEVYADGMKRLGDGIGEMVDYMISGGDEATVTEAVYKIEIETQPIATLNAVYNPDVSTIGKISVTAHATNDAEIEYRWVQIINGMTIENKNWDESSLSISMNLPGTYKYYCVLEADGCNDVTSETTTVTIAKADYTGETSDKIYVKANKDTTGNVYILPPSLSISNTNYKVTVGEGSLISGIPTVEYDKSDPWDWKWILTFGTSSQSTGMKQDIVLKITEDLIYKDVTFTLTVETTNKLPINITGVTGTDDAYSGLQQIGYTGSPNTGEFTGDLNHHYKGRKGTVYNSLTAPTDAGDYTVTLSIPEESDYTGTLDIDFPIKKKEILVWPLEPNILQGGELPTDIWINYTGFVGDDNSNNSISQWAEVKLNVKDSNTPGESAITFEKEATLFPEKEKNYTLKYENGKLIIQKSYMLTVIDSYASYSGAGRYSENFRDIPIDAGTRSGYIFEGWTSSDSVSFADPKSPTTKITILDKDVTVKANWMKSGNSRMEIIFDANGGTVSISSILTNTEGKLISLPTPTRTNYTFDGWFTAKTGGTKVTTATVFDKDTTIYAHWTYIGGSGGGTEGGGDSGGGGGGGGTTTPTIPSPTTPVEPKVIAPTEVKLGDILAKAGSFLPITDEVKEVKDTKVSIPLKEEEKQEMEEKGLTPRLFKFHETKRVWIPVKTQYNNGIVQTTNNVTGTYAVFGVAEPKFSDVKNNAWFSEDLDLAKAYGLINGILNDKREYEFRGDKTTSRAEFYTMVARLFGAKDDNGFSLYNILEGKGKGNTGWWTPYQEALESAGFLKDSGDANGSITRLEAMELLTALMKKADNATTQNANRFTDIDSSVEILTTISGYPDGTLRPNNSLTRAETITLIIKALEAQGW